MKTQLPNYQNLEEAAHWYVELSELNSHPPAFIDWLNQDNENKRAWDYVQSVNQRFLFLRDPKSQSAVINTLMRSNTKAMSRRHAMKIIAGCATIPLFLSSYYWYTPVSQTIASLSADYHSPTGKISHFILDDNSEIWLNTASAMDKHYSPVSRSLELISGEILIQTAKDNSLRPFIVDTPFGQMEALGTRFSARMLPDSLLLVVYEGKVAVKTKQSADYAVVSAGEQMIFDQEKCHAITKNKNHSDNWITGILKADNLLLGDVLDELSRYRSGHLGYNDNVANLRVMGTLPLTDTDLALSMLEKALPIKINQRIPWWTTIEKR